jgi:uncharacterized protein (DUF1684 family)
MSTPAPSDVLELLDWKRRVFELYGEIRAEADAIRAWRRWCDVRDDLFASHPQSPLSEQDRESFRGLQYFDYDPAARIVATVGDTDPTAHDIGTSGGGSYRFTRWARAEFELYGQALSLELHWLEGYGGGVFLPFADTTSGTTTYGAGRYLLDTAKGADLGMSGDRLVLDFNFAYNPSCAYDPRWVCPLAPPQNRLPVSVHAGERIDAPRP